MKRVLVSTSTGENISVINIQRFDNFRVLAPSWIWEVSIMKGTGDWGSSWFLNVF